MDYDIHQTRLKEEIELMINHRDAVIGQINQRHRDVLDRYTQRLTADKLKQESVITDLVKTRDFL